jgi:Putative phage tail protein
VSLFTLAATTLLATIGITGASTFVVGVVATGLAIATSIGLSYAAKALADKPEVQDEGGGVQLQLVSGADVPRSFQLGYSVTSGSLVYANTFGSIGETPNAYLTQVIALSDMPGCTLEELWVNGQLCTISAAVFPAGNAITQFYKGGNPYLFIKYYDGTQTTADGFLTGTFGSHAVRPYQSTRVGRGICYAVITSAVEDTLFSGVPTFKFGIGGIPLYDPSKDSTVGGSGSHVYSNPATWGGDGDDLPAVQAYNVLRGIRYNGAWMFGLQNMTGARLPVANWITQINKCRVTVTGVDGPEPTYRSGGQVNCDATPAGAMEAILTACQGRLSEIGGFYKIHLGTPDASAFAWTDADLLSSEQQTFRPFFSLADSINGIQGTYPDPAQGWETATAPALYRTDLEARDGNRRLMASPAFNFVPYPEQVQRLQKSAIEEAQRARTHVIPLPPAYWIIEPGDVGTWNSTRNGYVDKLFRVDSIVDRGNLDLYASVTEIDPSDYDWDHVTDYQGVATGPTAIVYPPPQGVKDWTATATVLTDNSFLGRHAAIQVTWDGTLLGIVGVQYEVRLAVDSSPVCNGRTDQYEAGALIISQGILPLTDYEVRGQYIPSTPRDMLWSGWIAVTTPAIEPADLPAWVSQQVTIIQDYLSNEVDRGMQLIASVASNMHSGNWIDSKQIREELVASSGEARASITEVKSVQVSDQMAFADYRLQVAASFNSTNASVTTNASAIATLNGYAAAQYSVTLDVNGYATGFNLFNGGAGISTFTVVVDKFQIAAPGVSGGAAVPIFTVANYLGAPKVGIRGDMYLDGTLAASAIVTGSITSDSGAIGALSVKALSIGDAAITVPAVQTLSSAEGAGSARTVNTVTLAIDTTGLSGKTIWILANWCGTIGYGGTGAAPQASLIIDGATVQTNYVTNSQDGFIALVGAAPFTASGGTDNKTVSVSYQAAATGTPQLLQRTLWATAAKR